MSKIIPIRDLKDTRSISKMCHESEDPIFITKNGYGDMVIMSVESYRKKMFIIDMYDKIIAAEKQLKEGKTIDGEVSLKSIREKYNV